MGVVTDVTVKGLTTAVTNISNTGMSDSTGQAIVTSINNLRSATSPIITDDTGQAINSTLQSLVEAISPSTSTDVSNLLTVTSGFTIKRKIAKKQNGIIMIDLCLDGSFTDGATIATVNSLIRPSDSNIRVIGNVANFFSGHAISDVCCWFFASNGQIQYYGSSINQTFEFSLMYII